MDCFWPLAAIAHAVEAIICDRDRAEDERRSAAASAMPPHLAPLRYRRQRAWALAVAATAEAAAGVAHEHAVRVDQRVELVAAAGLHVVGDAVAVAHFVDRAWRGGAGLRVVVSQADAQ